MRTSLRTWLTLRPRSHYSVFVSIRFCCIEATVHTAPFSYKNGEKNLRFCTFTLICPITKTQQKTSVFVRSHYSIFVKLIVGYWSVFKNLRFCAFTLLRFCEAHCWILERFQKPPFLWRFCADQCVHFHKNGAFISVFVQKRSSVDGALFL